MKSIYYFLLYLLLSPPTYAQIGLSTLSEIQIGNIPDRDPQDLRTAYAQINFDYTAAGFRAGLRSENFTASESGRNYGEIIQRYVHYRRGPFEVAAGHFYTIFGNGLLLHAFELPGVVTEERGSRRRYQITRDLDGVQLRYRLANAEFLFLRGTPVDSHLPPGLEGVDRRRGKVQGGGIIWHLGPHLETGLGLLQFKAGNLDDLGADLYARLRLAPLLERLSLSQLYGELYGEYAQRDAQWDRWFSLDRDLPRALYLSSTWTLGTWGLSLEYKDYEDFLIANANNPPPLIREHEAFLLNRITHDLLADDEAGFQSELTYAFAGGQMFTANYTRATRRWGPGSDDDDDLWEIFVQADTPFGDDIDAQFFADFSYNRILADEERTTVGTAWDWRAGERYGLNAEVQFQDIERKFGPASFPFKNFYVSFALNRQTDWSAALVLQRSTDELETGASLSGKTWWWGGNLNWQVWPGYSLDLFAGKRRSGLACTGGTCYEVLAFEGVSIRLLNQWL